MTSTGVKIKPAITLPDCAVQDSVQMPHGSNSSRIGHFLLFELECFRRIAIIETIIRVLLIRQQPNADEAGPKRGMPLYSN